MQRCDLSGEQRQKIINMVTSTLTQELGKGPANIKVAGQGSTITIKMFGTMSQIDKHLVSQGRADLAQEIRGAILAGMKPAWEDIMLRELGLEIGEIVEQVDFTQDCSTIQVYLR